MANLLDLPSELRAIIIAHATSGLSTIWTHLGCLPHKSGEYFDYMGNSRDKWSRISRCPSLLLVCHCLYDECLPVIYSAVTIQLLPRLLSHRTLIGCPGMKYVKSINIYIDLCLPKGCVSYDEMFPADTAHDVKTYLPNVTNIGLSLRDEPLWDTRISEYPLEKFFGDPSWSSLIKRISLRIEGRNRYALQAFLQSSRISSPWSLSATQRRTSILSVPFALVHLPELEELTIVMVTSLARFSNLSDDPDPIEIQGFRARNSMLERYTSDDSIIRNRQNQDFVIATKINDLFHATGKDVRILVKRCVSTEEYGGYVVEEKSLKQYSQERYDSGGERSRSAMRARLSPIMLMPWT